MNRLFDWLAPLQPVLSGRWWWVGALLVAIPAFFLLRELLPPLRRTRAAQCRRCGHPFDPATAFEDGRAVRCSECGREARSRGDAHVRPIRRVRAAAFALALCAVAAPLALWHNVHLCAARLLLPRWVVADRAELAGGFTVIAEFDPSQEYLGLWPNLADGAWSGGWGDAPPDTAPGAFMWPDRRRVRIVAADGRAIATAYLGPYVFGTDARGAVDSLPAAGSPGFGGDITGEGEPDLVLGEINVGSGGGVRWLMLDVPPAPAEIALREIGLGTFRADGPSRALLFDRCCAGFRYRVVPGAFLQDPTVACEWDPLARTWLPAAERMRAAPDEALLERCAAQARAAAAACLAEGPSPAAGGGPAFAPCPEAISPLARGVLHLALTGNGARWEQWASSVLPESQWSATTERFVAEMRWCLESCACIDTLRELNGPEFAKGAR